MTTIQIPVSDDLLHALGQRAIEDFLRRQTQLLRTQLLSSRLHDAIEASGIDWDKELEEAPQQAWDEYKRHQS